MIPSTIITISTALLAAISVAASDKAHASGCDIGDSKKLHCYNGPSDTHQKLETQHILHAAEYLRTFGEGSRDGGYWTMTAKEAPGCAEWTVYKHESVLVLAKHINNNDSSVLYTDIANTIDGGEDDEVPESLYSECDDTVYHYGGSYGVQFDPSNPAYHALQFTNGSFTPEGIVIKLVHNPEHKREEFYDEEDEVDDQEEESGDKKEQSDDQKNDL